LGCAGLGREDAIQHLMNYVFPNIFETTPHMLNAVQEAIEAMRVCVGPSAVFNYVVQGMFHPARKVREIYWRTYNSLYIGAQDALVASYPKIPDDDKNNYTRYELEYFL